MNSESLSASGQALVELGSALRELDYRFVTVTPETHRRVLARGRRASSLRDVFGWSQPFRREVIPERLLDMLRRANALDTSGEELGSRVRFSSLNSQLFVHSAYPTVQANAVFFGPDTYRFCSLLEREVTAKVGRAVDIGCGSGAGGLSLGERVGDLVLCDINPAALEYAQVNAVLNGLSASFVESDLLNRVSGEFDLIIANPPYLRDSGGRAYREGGGSFGEALAQRIVAEGIQRLAPGGRLVLYTGSAIVDGQDRFLAGIAQTLAQPGISTRYAELDPDVFGEELGQPVYADVERIAAVSLVITRTS